MYSWRVSAELKSELEREARLRNVPISSILDAAVRGWMENSAVKATEKDEQARLHASAEKFIGALAGHDPQRSTKARALVRERLRRRYGR